VLLLAELLDAAVFGSLLAPGLRTAGRLPPPMGGEADAAEAAAEPKELKKDEARDAARAAVLDADEVRLEDGDVDEVGLRPSRVSLGVSNGLPSSPLTMLSSPSRIEPRKSRSKVRR
jgi:hypothetical protein